MLLKWQTNQNSPLPGSRGRSIELMLYRQISALPSPVGSFCTAAIILGLIDIPYPWSSSSSPRWLGADPQHSTLLHGDLTCCSTDLLWGVTASITTGILTSSLLFLRFFSSLLIPDLAAPLDYCCFRTCACGYFLYLNSWHEETANTSTPTSFPPYSFSQRWPK